MNASRLEDVLPFILTLASDGLMRGDEIFMQLLGKPESYYFRLSGDVEGSPESHAQIPDAIGRKLGDPQFSRQGML